MMRHGLLLMFLLTAVTAGAQEPIRQLPVKLRADRIEFNQRTGESRYLGRVVLNQGTAQLTADRAEARALDHELERVTAHGQPLTFRETLQDGSGAVEGEARHAEYDAKARQVHLSERVELRYGENILNAGRIRYDIDHETAHAERDADQRVSAAVVPRRRDGEGILP